MHGEKFKQLCEYISKNDRQSLTRLNILLVLPVSRYSDWSKGRRYLEKVYEWESYSVPLCFSCSSSYNLFSQSHCLTNQVGLILRPKAYLGRWA